MKNGVFWVVTPCGSEPHGVTTQKTPFLTRSVKNILKFRVYFYTRLDNSILTPNSTHTYDCIA
jgi:hypothetical protein